MKKLLFPVLFLLVHFCFGQQQELKQFCKDANEMLSGPSALHLEYVLKITGKNGDEERMPMQLYRKGDMVRLIMGETQEVLQKGTLLLVANHAQKTILLQEDSSAQNDLGLIQGLTAMVDSAASVKKSQSENWVGYTLSFGKGYIYKSVEIRFNSRTKELLLLHAVFSPEYPGQFESMHVDYQRWDRSWKPEAGFPNMDKYITKTGNKYQVQNAWKSYQFFQPKRGTLKF